MVAGRAIEAGAVATLPAGRPTTPKLFPIAHGGVVPAPPPGSGSTAVGIVCKLPNGAALIAAGFPPNPLGFLIAKPATAPVPLVAADIAFSPMPWVCADSLARPKNSVGSARPQLPNYRARRLPNRNPSPSSDPLHVGKHGARNVQKVVSGFQGCGNVD